MTAEISDVRANTLRYLRVSPGAPWRWEEDGRVLVWSDGTTIAFREEVNAVIDRMALRGLPPFASVAVLLAACRGKLPPLAVSGAATGDGRTDLLRGLQQRDHALTLAELEKLTALPSPLLKSAAAKAALVAAILEGLVKERGKADGVEQGQMLLFAGNELNAPTPDAAPIDLPAVCRQIAGALRGHTADSLSRLVKTGLSTMPGPAVDLRLPGATGIRQLLGQLATDPSYAGLVSATRDLMAAIRLPTAIVAVEELALGGASGLGNRGPLDRLLLSELAHDDLTLAARVALNEALYLQREPPVLKPEQELVVVLDSGLRMWGVPRLMGISAALALFAGHRGTGVVSIWRPEGKTFAPVDAASREGLEQHLAVLRPELDFRAALSALDASLDPEGNTDVVFITHRDAMRDPDFAAGLAMTGGRRQFVVTVDHSGGAALYTLPWGAVRPLAQTQTDPNRLQEPRSRTNPQPQLRDNTTPRGDLPAIFFQKPFPLLLPVTGQVEGVAAVGKGGGLAAMGDRRLLAWDSNERGARQILTGVASGRLVFLLRDQKRRVVVGKSGAQRDLTVTILDESQGEPLVTQCTARRGPLAVFPDGNVLLLVLHTRVTAISLELGKVVEECRYPEGVWWRSGRYFASIAGFKYVFWNGSSVQWDEVPALKSSPSEVVVLFDRAGAGPWLVLATGSIRSPDGREVMATGFSVTGGSALNDGELLLLLDKQGVQHAVDLSRMSVHRQSKSANSLVCDRVAIPTQAMQMRFSAVYGVAGEPLRLRKRNGHWLEIDATNGALRLTAAAGKAAEFERDKRDFSEPLGGPGCRLRVAAWPGGSRAWLDSRGLLHLRSGDAAVEELTLTLNQGMMAAWSGAGTVAGPEFFIGEKIRSDASAIVNDYREFCAKLC